MATKAARGKTLAKAALAKTNTIIVNIEGDYEDSRQQFLAMASELGFTFDSNNAVVNKQIVDDVALLQSKILSLVTLLDSTFDGSGNIDTDGYNPHTHTETGTETLGVS